MVKKKEEREEENNPSFQIMRKEEPKMQNQNQLSASKANPDAEITALDHPHQQQDSKIELKLQSLEAPENAASGPKRVAGEPEVGCRKGMMKKEEESGRERLKRHRVEVAGQVWIPDLWGQEELLKGWIDCSAFDSALVPKGLLSARTALVEEGRRANSGRLRIQNSY